MTTRMLIRRRWNRVQECSFSNPDDALCAANTLFHFAQLWEVPAIIKIKNSNKVIKRFRKLI